MYTFIHHEGSKSTVKNKRKKFVEIKCPQKLREQAYISLIMWYCTPERE